jgi:hypothetical protein
MALESPVVYGPEATVTYTYDGTNASAGESAAGSTTTAARAARRLLLSEVLARPQWSPAWLYEELRHAPSEVAAPITILLGDPRFGRAGLAIARRVLAERPELGAMSRHLAVARLCGGMSLRHTATIDRFLGRCHAIRAAARL